MSENKRQLRAEQREINRQRDFTCMSCSKASDVDYITRTVFCAGFDKRVYSCWCMSYQFRGVRRNIVELAKGKVRA